jgi:hypothetical protein
MRAAAVAERVARPLEAPIEPGKRALRRGLLAAVAAGAVFVLLQALLAAYNLHVFHQALAKRVDQGSVSWCLGHCMRQAIPEALFAYIGFALIGVVVAVAGRRVLSALPASLYVLYGVPHGIHSLMPIGLQWQVQCYDRCPGVWFGFPVLGAAVDLALVLAPAMVVAWSVRPERWPGPVDRSTVAAIGLALGLAILTYRTSAVIGRPPDPATALALGAFGVAAGARRPWWPWVPVVAATTVGGYFVFLWSSIVAPDPGFTVSWSQALLFFAESVVPILVLTVLGSSWTLWAAALRKGTSRPLWLLAGLNVLNLADALLTQFAVRSGGALELNPLVRVVGLPLKLVAVGALSVLLYKRRPAALMWPIAVLLWVLCYHVSGIIVNR